MLVKKKTEKGNYGSWGGGGVMGHVLKVLLLP